MDNTIEARQQVEKAAGIATNMFEDLKKASNFGLHRNIADLNMEVELAHKDDNLMRKED